MRIRFEKKERAAQIVRDRITYKELTRRGNEEENNDA